MAFKSLQTSFAGSKGRKRSVDSNAPVTPSLSSLSPSTKKIRRSASHSRPSFAISPIKFRGYDDEDSDDSDQLHDEDVFNIPRHDEIFQPITSASKGVRRLAIKDILRLDSGDEFILFIPPFNRNDKKVWSDTSKTVLGLMKRIIMSSFSKTTTPQDREIGWQNHLRTRQRERDGSFGYEFNVRVIAYPSRDLIEMDSLPSSSVDYLVDPASGAGLTLELLGYGPAISCHIKLPWIPFVEAYIPIKDSDCVIAELQDFTNSTNEDTLYTSMAKLLHESKGDTYSYANILLTYYKRALKSSKSTNKAIMIKQQSAIDDSLFENIASEVERKKIELFAKSVDDHCYQCLKSTIGFDYVRRSLVLEEDLLGFYRKFQESFPTTHRIFHSIVSSQHFNEKHEIDTDDLHRKQRLILFLFLATIRCKSVFLMKSWAIIEPLGLYYKGQQQLSAKTFSGAFSMSLPTSLAALDKIYKENMPHFYAKLQKTKVICGAFDNYQQNFEKKNKTEHKSSLMQRGTSFYLKEVKNVQIVRGSTVRSPHGLIFKVTKCEKRGDNRSFVKGYVYSVPKDVSPDVIAAEKNFIHGGMLLPLLDWTVVDMPGLSPMPSLDFFKQNVPPPRLAWISADASSSDLLFGLDRKFRQPTDHDVKSFETQSMHELVCKSQRMILLNTIAKRIDYSIEKGEESIFNIGSTEAEIEFVNLMKIASPAMDRAAKFETDLIAHINPLADIVDKIFIFPLSPHCETTHEGMKMVFTDLCQHFQLIHIDKKGLVALQSSANDRKVFLCVDALSAKQFRILYFNLTKKLSELGNTQTIEQLLRAYELFVCQHDYLHEHRMHRQDVIWRIFMGGVLQAFIAETRMQRISGDPVKSNLQGHERFLEIVRAAIDIQRVTSFVKYMGVEFFKRDDNESVESVLMRIEMSYSEYCKLWEDSQDIPSQILNNLINMLTSYFRCVKSVKCQNFWLLEEENIRWLGAYKACGKNNYHCEGLNRIETLYGDSFLCFVIAAFKDIAVPDCFVICRAEHRTETSLSRRIGPVRSSDSPTQTEHILLHGCLTMSLHSKYFSMNVW